MDSVREKKGKTLLPSRYPPLLPSRVLQVKEKTLAAKFRPLD